MTDSLPPVAIRVVRPYATDEELLENELETLTRASITLLGAQPRPQGLVLRFELVLSSGQTLVRGEGRVVGYKPNALYGIGGLTLRFTRLDTRSKAFVDRAAALRERRRPSAGQNVADAPSASIPPPVPDYERRQMTSSPELQAMPEPPPPPPRRSVPPEPPLAPPPRQSTPPPSQSTPPPRQSTPPPRQSAPPEASAPIARTPRDRDALLERLRARSKALVEGAVDKPLDRRR